LHSQGNERARQLARIAALAVVDVQPRVRGCCRRSRVIVDVLRGARQRRLVEKIGAEEPGSTTETLIPSGATSPASASLIARPRTWLRHRRPAGKSCIAADRRDIDDVAGVLPAHMRQQPRG